jgi:hypothetical protein
VKQIRSVWSQVRIVVRGDSGFCREELMAWCEAEVVDYLLGLAKNERLKTEIEKERGEAKAQYQETGRAARLFKELVYQTRESWSRARRVVAKAEHLEKGENPSLTVRAWNSVFGRCIGSLKLPLAPSGCAAEYGINVSTSQGSPWVQRDSLAARQPGDFGHARPLCS